MKQLRATGWPQMAILLAVGWLVYSGGLHGGFLFDDFPNLAALGATGPVDDWPTFWRYITSGSADPFGRPLALLSFLLDGRDWPTDPAPFLRTNLLLHLLTGALLFALLRSLGRLLDGTSTSATGAALVGAGLWLLHPLHVSTTLYIVQRQAMLPATFTLLGLLAYVHGRIVYVQAPRAGATWMVIGIAGGTVLAMLCKANGVLLPLLAWVIDATVLRSSASLKPGTDSALRKLRWLQGCLLVFPAILVLGYVASFLTRLDVPVDRPWTIGQRLLTEPRVILDYLNLLVVPRVLSTGLYNDDYPVSTALLQPASTALSLLMLSALLVLAFGLRRRAPAVSAALLFFFAGHLLESTTVPLELYFEHRNYLPALLLFWPLGRALCAWRAAPALRTCAAMALLAIFALTTSQRAAVWGKPDLLARLWAIQNPKSARAQATAATYDLRGQHPELALIRLRALWQQRPHDLQLALNYANAACAKQGLTSAEAHAIADALNHAKSGDQLVHRWLGRAIEVVADDRCPGLDERTIALWLMAAWRNPQLSSLPGRRQDLYSLQGQLALLRGEPALALAAFNQSLSASATPGAAARQAAILAEQGHYTLALLHLDHFSRLQPRTTHATAWNMPGLHQWVLQRQGYWPRELTILRGRLEQAVVEQKAERGGGAR